jgi:arylsulfatase A
MGFTGNTMTDTPHIDALAYGGKVLNSWYSGCPVCSGSRTALMTGRQYTRVGVPGVFGDGSTTGLPLNETTVADQLKGAGYKTAIMGKWHLGQRPMFLPGARGFDTYMGIPYSDDMGKAARSPCPGQQQCGGGAGAGRSEVVEPSSYVYTLEDDVHGTAENLADLNSRDPADLTPLVFQAGGVPSTPGAQTKTGAYAGNTTILQQPVDFTTLAPKYETFVTDFIEASKDEPFFLYMPFSHVHTTNGNQPQNQYASCRFQNTSKRGAFGDALAEVDWLIGSVHDKLKSAGIEENTLILFTGDNGPWMVQGLSGGSTGLLYGRYSGYWNTGKGSTWEGGIHEAAFAYWKGQIEPGSRSSEVVSSLDLFPTASALAGAALPADRVYDGRDMSGVLLQPQGKSLHDVLFFYGGGKGGTAGGPSAARMGCWKAHWGTAPGMGGCELGAGQHNGAAGIKCPSVQYPADDPLIFNVCIDPSEGMPFSGADSGKLAGGAPYVGSNPGPTDGRAATDGEVQAAKAKLVAAYQTEIATFTRGTLVEPDLLPGEVGATVRICCDKDPFKAPPANFSCDCDGSPYSGPTDSPLGYAAKC